jgi:hypothetical protein
MAKRKNQSKAQKRKAARARPKARNVVKAARGKATPLLFSWDKVCDGHAGLFLIRLAVFLSFIYRPHLKHLV